MEFLARTARNSNQRSQNIIVICKYAQPIRSIPRALAIDMNQKISSLTAVYINTIQPAI